MPALLHKQGANTLERKAWRRVFGDGLWDLYLGAVFANVAVWMAASLLGWSVGQTAVPFVGFLIVMLGVFRQAKPRITEPRVGYFKIASGRARPITRSAYVGVAVTVLLVAVTFIAGITGVPADVPFATTLFGIVALQMALMFGLAAYALGVRRFFAYAALGAAGYVGSEALTAARGADHGWDIVAMFGLPAMAMLPIGTVLLVRFLRAYPLPKDAPDA
jgi:hypothetical protein